MWQEVRVRRSLDGLRGMRADLYERGTNDHQTDRDEPRGTRGGLYERAPTTIRLEAGESGFGGRRPQAAGGAKRRRLCEAKSIARVSAQPALGSGRRSRPDPSRSGAPRRAGTREARLQPRLAPLRGPM